LTAWTGAPGDLIVGAYQAELSGKTLIGKSYVVFGKANNSAIEHLD
jgi:hypothetical protein